MFFSDHMDRLYLEYGIYFHTEKSGYWCSFTQDILKWSLIAHMQHKKMFIVG